MFNRKAFSILTLVFFLFFCGFDFAKNKVMPDQSNVCNAIAEFRFQDNAFKVNGYSFYASNFDYPNPDNRRHWYVKIFNPAKKTIFYCACFNFSGKRQCMATH